jgi:hypothetical protein
MSLDKEYLQILDFAKSQKPYLYQNFKLLDIYNGRLLPYIDKILKQSLSQEYYEKIKDRIIPINVLKRISDKISKSYTNKPERKTIEKYQEDLSFYQNHFYMDQIMSKVEEYAFMHKAYALEPFMFNGVPRLRALPFDRFMVYSNNKVDPTFVTHFVKFLGKIPIKNASRTEYKELYYIYTDSEFIAVTEDGSIYYPDMQENQGVNPYGTIPFMYGNRGNDMLLPTQDTDMEALSKIIPILMTDLAGAIMFQCFTVIYGIDVSAENLTMSPNAFWSLKSDLQSNKQPVLGTIKPEADIDKVISFVGTVFSFWLETKGVRVGSMGTLNSSNLASGISKLIDELDVNELVKKSMESFKKEEKDFWFKIKKMNNTWVSQNEFLTNYKPSIWLDDFDFSISFDEPQPYVDRRTEVETIKLERDAGFLDNRSSIKYLYPDLTEEQIDERIKAIDQDKIVVTQ